MKKKNKDEYGALDNLKKAYKYAKKQKKEFILYFLANVILCILGAIIPLLSAKQLLKITDGLLNQLLSISFFILIVELFRNICNFLARKYSQIFAREILKNIQIDMANELLKIETADFDKKSSGVFIDRLVKDTSRISDIFLQLNVSLTDFITNIGILIAIFVINKIMFIYYIVSVTIVFLLERMRIKKFNELDKHYRKVSEKTTGLAGELVRGLRDIKVLNAGKSFMKVIEEKFTMINQERYKMSETTRTYSLVVSSVRDLLDFVLILLAVIMIKNSRLTIANFVIIYMYRGRIMGLLTLFSTLLEWFKDFNLSAGRVFEILDSTIYHKEKFGSKHLKNVKGDFEFKDVHFGYNEEQEVLKGVSFKIKHNQTVSFVGRSGAGKSTLFSLIAKLYSPTQGEILMDGVNIDELDQDTLRGNVSIITQNPYIFNMTIRENLTIVKNGLSEEEMIKACKMARLHDFVMSLPDGYDTLIGEAGINLSGGQKQRLAIARALVQNTNIILFDEATSALDNETQNDIQEAINAMKNKYTILIIAHRLSTVINSDNIMMLDKGQIVASGKHKELLKNNEFYQKLYNIELKK